MGNEHAVLARLDRARKCYGEVEALAGVDLKVAEALAERVAVLNRGPIVAEGSVHEVRSRVAQRRIRCTTALAAEWVSAWPHVLDARRDGERLEVIADTAEPVVRRLLAEDGALAELEVQRAGLKAPSSGPSGHLLPHAGEGNGSKRSDKALLPHAGRE